MIGEICAEIKNYFVLRGDIHVGNWEISNGQISPSLNFPTDYIRIVGSRQNDGVHRLSDGDLIDEGEFEGGVWIMSPPKDFLNLVEEIEAWQKEFSKVANSPYSSESFGGYSYMKSSVNGATWQKTFAQRLNRYRRIRL